MQTLYLSAIRALRPLGTKARIVGQKRPLMPKGVWAIRAGLELSENHRGLALVNMAINSKQRGCDLVRMKVVDVMASGQVKERASVLQSKTRKPVRFEISEDTQIYKKTGNLRAIQLLLRHTKMDSTVRYVGVELEDALAISEAVEI